MTVVYQKQSVLATQPTTLMGVPVTADQQIWLCLLVPTVAHIIIYVLDLAFCIAVIHCHYKEENFLWAGLSLLVLYIPPFIFFTSIVSKPDEWDEQLKRSRAPYWFTIRLTNFLLFPAWGIYRYAKQFFWAVEALTHNDDEREEALIMATKSSRTELMLFLHAFLNCAPQSLLQLTVLFVEIDNNVETDSMQVLCIASSLMVLAATIVSFQRFESQKVLGRQKPWAQVKERIASIQTIHKPEIQPPKEEETTTNEETEGTPYLEPKAQHSSLTNAKSDWEIMGLDLERDIPSVSLYLFPRRMSLPQSPPPESPKHVEELSKSESSVRILSEPWSPSPPPSLKNTTLVLSPPNCPPPPPPVSETSQNTARILPSNRPSSPPPPIPGTSKYIGGIPPPNSPPPPPPTTTETSNYIGGISPPNSPPPPPPTTTETSYYIGRISSPNLTPPTPPKQDVLQVISTERLALPRYPPSPELKPIKLQPSDQTNTERVSQELPLPSRKIKFKGLEQDDLVGRSVLFIGWWFFLLSRILSLVSFAHFFPAAAAGVYIVHYIVTVGYMVKNISYTGVNRMLVPIYLGYVYLFCIIEFRTRFKKALLTLCIYIAIITAENVTLSSVWYFEAEWEGWWYKYTYILINGNLLISISAMVTYYLLLKPKSRTFYEDV